MSEDSGNTYDLKRLQDRVRPLQLRHARVVTSTNDWAKQEVESGLLQAPALLVADSQSAGRGRGTNTWWSAMGNIAATFVVPQNPHLAFGLVPLLAGLAVRRALVRLVRVARTCSVSGAGYHTSKWRENRYRYSETGLTACEGIGLK